MENDIQIQYLGLQTRDVELKINTYNKSAVEEVETQLKVSNGFSGEDNTIFVIIFEITIENKEKNFFVKVEAHNHFKLNQEITESFKKSAFVNISAPAIAFPYVRAFISNMTLNAGYDPIILPSFNFVKILENNSNK